LRIGEALRLGREVADAIDAAHRAGVVHRDLKPANVMVTRTGAKVLDFGVAKYHLPGSGADASSASLASTLPLTLTLAETADGSLVGTLPYMAPEQLAGSRAGPSADIWALGCLLYELVTGTRPFHGATAASLISSIMNAQPEPPTRRLTGRVRQRTPDLRPLSRRPAVSGVPSPDRARHPGRRPGVTVATRRRRSRVSVRSVTETNDQTTTLVPPVTDAEPTTDGAFSPEGIDLTLIRSMLELSPGARLRLVQDLMDGVAVLGRRGADDP
jgi:serine/threonine protein kinase